MTRRTMQIGDIVVVNNAELDTLGLVVDASSNPALTGNVAQNGAPAFRIHALHGSRRESGATIPVHDDIWIRDDPWQVRIDGVEGFTLPEFFRGNHVSTMLANAGVQRRPIEMDASKTAEAQQRQRNIVIIIVCVALIAAAIWIWFRQEHRTEVNPSIPLSQSYVRNCGKYISDDSRIRPYGNAVTLNLDAGRYLYLPNDDIGKRSYECFARQIGYTKGEQEFIREMVLATALDYYLINDTFLMACEGDDSSGAVSCAVANRAFP